MIVLDTASPTEGHRNAVHVKVKEDSQNLNHIRENCALGVS
jgi:hypothetical protein